MNPRKFLVYGGVGLAFSVALLLFLAFAPGVERARPDGSSPSTTLPDQHIEVGNERILIKDIKQADVTVTTKNGKVVTGAIDPKKVAPKPEEPATTTPSPTATPMSPKDRLVIWIVAIAAVVYGIYFLVVLVAWARHIFSGNAEPPAFLKDHVDKAVASLIALVLGFIGGANLNTPTPKSTTQTPSAEATPSSPSPPKP